MGRSRGFDDENVRRAIMLEFWNRGYEATSITDLENATSLPRTSLYNAFGDKAELLTISLADYHNMIEEQFDQAIETHGFGAVFVAFDRLLADQNTEVLVPKGCLMLGVATHSIAVSNSHLEQVTAYRRMLVKKFESMLLIGQNEGIIGAKQDCQSLAEILTCILWGVLAAKCINQARTGDLFDLKGLESTVAGWR